MEGGPQPRPAAFVTVRSHAQRVYVLNDVAKAGCMGAQSEMRILPKDGGDLGLRSQSSYRRQTENPFSIRVLLVLAGSSERAIGHL